LEPLHGYLLIAEGLAEDRPEFASGWNFGPAETDAKPVSWIADRLASLWGNGASWIRDSTVHPPESGSLKLDASKARAYLSWHPVLPLNSALPWIVEWYRAFETGADLGKVTRAQIERYEELLKIDDECIRR